MLFTSIYMNGQKYDRTSLAENIILALKNENFELFKTCLFSLEDWKQFTPEITNENYSNYVSKIFLDCQKEFTKLGLAIKDFELIRVNEPYKSETKNNVPVIHFKSILSDGRGTYLLVDFSDVVELESGYKLSEQGFRVEINK